LVLGKSRVEGSNTTEVVIMKNLLLLDSTVARRRTNRAMEKKQPIKKSAFAFIFCAKFSTSKTITLVQTKINTLRFLAGPLIAVVNLIGYFTLSCSAQPLEPKERIYPAGHPPRQPFRPERAWWDVQRYAISMLRPIMTARPSKVQVYMHIKKAGKAYHHRNADRPAGTHAPGQCGLSYH
jgi:hypothetical protein